MATLRSEAGRDPFDRGLPDLVRELPTQSGTDGGGVHGRDRVKIREGLNVLATWGATLEQPEAAHASD